MFRDEINPQDVCDLLNEFLELDPEGAQELFSHRVACNEKVAEHSTIQVRQFLGDEVPKIGFIGLLNGMFGVRPDGMGPICCYEGDTGKITSFKPTPKPYTEY